MLEQRSSHAAEFYADAVNAIKQQLKDASALEAMEEKMRSIKEMNVKGYQCQEVCVCVCV